jgi:aspartyl-tRNA(Asn)/glutamyl-tRNA(Gln) amidotransferase subunit A
MARSVIDLGILFQVVAGSGKNQDTTNGWPFPEVIVSARGTEKPEWCQHFLRVRGLFETRADPAMREAMDRFVLDFRDPGDAGARVEEASLPPGFAQLHAHHRTIMAVEAADYHALRLGRHPDDYPPRIRELVEEGLRSTAVEYRQALQARDHLRSEIGATVNAGGLALLTPAAPGRAPDPSTTGDAVFNAPWSFTGQPTVSFPIAQTQDDLPLAVQIVGQKCMEGLLLVRAAWCEERFGRKMGLPPVP